MTANIKRGLFPPLDSGDKTNDESGISSDTPPHTQHILRFHEPSGAESYPMDQHILYDEVLVNGSKTALTLSADGILQWYDHQNVLQCLSVEKEVLGVSIVGQQIIIRSFIETEGGGFCFGSSTRNLVRKSFVFEPSSEDSRLNLCEKIQGYVDSLGSSSTSPN